MFEVMQELLDELHAALNEDFECVVGNGQVDPDQKMHACCAGFFPTSIPFSISKQGCVELGGQLR